MCLIDLEAFYLIDVLTHIGFLSKFCLVAQHFASIKHGDGSYLKNKLEPFVLELHIMPLLGVFGQVECISDVNGFSSRSRSDAERQVKVKVDISWWIIN